MLVYWGQDPANGLFVAIECRCALSRLGWGDVIAKGDVRRSLAGGHGAAALVAATIAAISTITLRTASDAQLPWRSPQHAP
jgi:hypothetical protein